MRINLPTTIFTALLTAHALIPQMAVADKFGDSTYSFKGKSGNLGAYDEEIRLHPKSAQAYLNRGTAYLTGLDSSSAIRDFTIAIELNPKFGEAYMQRGRAQLDCERFQQALDDLSQAAKLGPPKTSYLALRESAHVYEKLSQNAKARDLYKQLLQHPQAEKYLLYERMGACDISLKNYEQAVEDCSMGIKADPTYEPALEIRARAYAKLKKWKEALQDYNRAIALGKSSFKIHKLYKFRGEVYEQLGNHKLAAQDKAYSIQLEDGTFADMMPRD